MTTIRRNAAKKIEAILNAAILIREYRYDDMGDTNRSQTPAEVLAAMKEGEADRVWLEDSGVLRITMHRGWSYTAYPSVEAARASLTPEAFAKWFPAESKKKTAPERYAEIKSDHPDTPLILRVGDFYELFGDDAKQIARIVGLTVTIQNIGKPNELAMCGFPYHQLDAYLRKLICAGIRCAVCEV